MFTHRNCRLGPRLLLLAFLQNLPAIAHAQTITEYSLPGGNTAHDIIVGPDGNLWFTEFRATILGTTPDSKIGRITTAGVITEFPTPEADSGPLAIAAGPDGNLWFTETYGNRIERSTKIGRITTAGVITEFPIPTALSGPFGIAAGPDGNVWFTEAFLSKIGRITTAGVITEFPIPTAGSFPVDIAAGPDDNLWFTDEGLDQIGRITPDGVVTEFAIPTFEASPLGITAGPDGNLWFTEAEGHKIGRITTSGIITEFSIPTFESRPAGIAAGPDGALWFTEYVGNKIGRITTSGIISEFSIATPNSHPGAITAGPDGNIWFTLDAGRVGRLTLSTSPVIDSRILPVVGSTPGVGGSFFKTSVQLHNSTNSTISGRIVFHPSGLSGSSADPALSYTLSPGQTQSIADLLPAMGRSGLGSADIEVTSGSVPAVSARVFNDAGEAGTTGFTEEPMRAEEALRPGASGVLLLPADLTSFRFNLGVRTLGGGATATLTLRDSAGTVVATISRSFPLAYQEQQSASAFLGVSTLPAGGSISIGVSAGAAIFYGATVDNTTGDPSLQIARAPQ